MAQAGYTPIQLYLSTTASAVPSAGNLANGELAINITDGKLFYKDNGGVVQVLATKAGASGDVVGPGSSTDNALVRFDSTTGKLVQNSVGILDDSGNLTGIAALTTSGALTLNGGTANGVAYLNGSKVLTTGSALTFNGTTLTANTLNLTNALGVAHGGTGATSAAGALTNLGAYPASNPNGYASGTVTSVASGSGLTGGTITTAGTLAIDTSVVSTLTGTQTLTNKTLTSPILGTAPDLSGSFRGNIVAVAALDIDCSLGNYFTKTIAGASTFTFSNAPASRAYSFTLELTFTSGSITWPTAVQWPGGTVPTITAGKTNLFMFVTDDGGTRWRGASLVDYTT